jgi:hypothetical protein
VFCSVLKFCHLLCGQLGFRFHFLFESCYCRTFVPEENIYMCGKVVSMWEDIAVFCFKARSLTRGLWLGYVSQDYRHSGWDSKCFANTGMQSYLNYSLLASWHWPVYNIITWRLFSAWSLGMEERCVYFPVYVIPVSPVFEAQRVQCTLDYHTTVRYIQRLHPLKSVPRLKYSLGLIKSHLFRYGYLRRLFYDSLSHLLTASAI